MSARTVLCYTTPITAYRTLRLATKYTLAAFGGYLLFMLWWERFGLPTTLWLLLAPACWGVYQGLLRLREFGPLHRTDPPQD